MKSLKNSVLSAETNTSDLDKAAVMCQPHFTNTVGGWKYRPDAVDKGFYIETVDMNHQNTFIGDVGGGLQSKGEIEANAKLIAAAPELLHALLAAKKELDLITWETRETFDKVHSALEKAIGLDLRKVRVP